MPGPRIEPRTTLCQAGVLTTKLNVFLILPYDQAPSIACFTCQLPSAVLSMSVTETHWLVAWHALKKGDGIAA